MKIQVNDLVTHYSLQLINHGRPYKVTQIIEEKDLAQVIVDGMVFWLNVDELTKAELSI